MVLKKKQEMVQQSQYSEDKSDTKCPKDSHYLQQSGCHSKQS